MVPSVLLGKRLAGRTRGAEKLRYLPFAMAALYICECMAGGRCEGWILHAGMVYKPEYAQKLLEGDPSIPCIAAERLLEKLGDVRLLRVAALAHYAAVRGIDAGILPGVEPEELETVQRVLREARLLPLLL